MISKLNSSLSITISALLMSSSVLAKDFPNSTLTFLKKCAVSEDCELQFIKEIAKTYRPPKEEKELRDYIISIKDMSEKHIWKQKLKFDQDKIGNIMITLPATGRFANTKSKPFALQSHMDMVLAYADAKPGEDVRPYFKDGIKLEIKDGWLQSKGNKTSIGTDNSSGVAYSLRYIIDPSIEHPELELIFTVQEEIGLVGAFNSDLPIKSKKMLCLDGMTPEPGYIIAGAQGAVAQQLNFKTQEVIETKTSDFKMIKISVTKLAGGHSGGDIHRNRTNAIKAFATLAKFISSQINDEVRIKTLVAGDIGIFNKIPNLFQAELAIPKNKISNDLNYQIEKYLKDLISKNSDDAANAIVSVNISEESGDVFVTSDYDFTKYLVDSILQSPNGIVEKDKKFFNEIKTSNNLSFLEVKADSSSKEVSNKFGFMARGFDNQGMNSVKDIIFNQFSDEKQLRNIEKVQGMSIAPWLEPDSSELLKQVTSLPELSKRFYLNGGLEPSAFKLKIKDLEVIALGPYQQMAHSVNEKLKIDTIAPTGKNILKIIQTQK